MPGPPRIADHPVTARVLGDPHYAMSITSRCQQRCACCFEGSHSAGEDTPLDEIRRHLEVAAARVPYVVFMGAESTLHRQFAEVVELAGSLGLLSAVSSNLLRFADDQFLRRCADAGLRAFEFSFHYPDAETFAELTGTRADGFQRLLQAMRNVGSLCHERNTAPPPSRVRQRVPGGPDTFYPVGPNVVVSTANVDRLPAVLEHVARELGPSFRQVTFKRLLESSLAGGGLDHSWVPEGERVRAALSALLDGWRYPRTVALLRDYPMCIAPGYEHLHADLLYHARLALVVQNFGQLPAFEPMYDYAAVESTRLRRGCSSCRLVQLCRVVTHGSTSAACPSLRPVPSRREPAEVLQALGVSPVDASLFLERLGSPPAASRPAPKGAAPVGAPRITKAVADKATRVIREALAAEDGVSARLERVGVAREKGRLEIHLAVDGTAVELALFGAGSAEPRFASSKRFAIAHARATQLPHAADRLIYRILRSLERSL